MDLYLNLNRPEGKRFRLIQRGAVNNKVKPIILYPDRPTKVDNELAALFMEQDPELIVTKAPKFAPEAEEVTVDPHDPGITQALAEIAEAGDLKKLKVRQLEGFAQALGLELPKKLAKSMKASLIEARCDEIVTLLEAEDPAE